MKFTKVLFSISFLMAFSLSQNVIAAYDSLVAAYIKKMKFGLELYELSCASDELLSLIEKDTVNFKAFKVRLERAFDPRLNESQKYFYRVELSFLIESIENKDNASVEYQKSLALLKNVSKKNSNKIPPKPIATIVQEFIEYPEQVDDVFIILLLSNLPKTVWRDIKSDNATLYRFNTWIKYGFEEFRYFPSTLNSVKGVMTQRIIKAIKAKNDKADDELIIQSLGMFERVEANYKK